MLNKDKYAKEIVEKAINYKNIAFNIKTNKICDCDDIDCKNCQFNISFENDCQGIILKDWANSEYIGPKKIFTEDEKTFIRLLKNIKYVARDSNGNLFLYRGKPEKSETDWAVNRLADNFRLSYITDLQFNSIQWEDEEPTSREEILGE